MLHLILFFIASLEPSKFIIQVRKRLSGSWGSWKTAAKKVGAGKRAFAVTDLTPSKKHQMRIRGHNIAGKGSWKKTKTFKTK